MSDLMLLREASARFGEPLERRLVPAEFPEDLLTELRFPELHSESTAIVDNTSIRNALTLLREGLGDEASDNGVFLPDLAALVFALSSFDTVLLLAHGLDQNERAEVEQFFGSAVRVFDFRAWLGARDSERHTSIYRIFAWIQRGFQEHPGLHPAWQRSWATLLDAKPSDVKPYFLNEAMPHDFIDSPRHPFVEEALSLQEPLGTPRSRKRLPKSLDAHRSSFEARGLHLRAAVSYQTFRGVFYFALADLLGYPYVPCAMRGLVPNFLPFDPNGPHIGERAAAIVARVIDAENGPATAFESEYALLALRPTLAAFVQCARESSGDWAAVFSALRARSKRQRDTLAAWIHKLRVGELSLAEVEQFRADLTAGREPQQGLDSVLRVCGDVATEIVPRLIKAHIAQLNHLSEPSEDAVSRTFKWLFKSVIENPLEAILRSFNSSFRFYFAARDLANAAIDIDEDLAAVFGRPLTGDERAYLERLRLVQYAAN